MYDVIVEAINNLKKLTVSQGEQLDGISGRLETIRKQLLATHVGHEEEDWDKEFIYNPMMEMNRGDEE